MAITTWDGYIASAKQPISFVRTAARTSVAAAWFSVFDLAGNPGAGVLAGTSTAAGVVPTDATAGCPVINAFGGGAVGYLAQVDFGSNAACRIKLFDMLFKAGAYAFNANTALAAQPSYSSRVPGGTDFADTQIWIEAVTAFTGNPTITVTYTNQSGAAGRTTGAVALGLAPTVGRMIQLPLQSGDTGVQKIESVVATVATVGTFNVLVLSPLWSGRVKIANDGDVHDLAKTGMPVIYTDSAVVMTVSADATSTGIPELEFVVANG
jgi:hypothetical protein